MGVGSAVDLYHSIVPFNTGSGCCWLLEIFTLPCRQKFIETERVYAEPEELKKVGTYIESSKKSENNRCQGAEANGKLTAWEGAVVPDKPKLVEMFGKLHYGWTDQESLAENESVV